MTASEWFTFVRTYGKYVLRDILPSESRMEIIYDMMDILKELASYTVHDQLYIKLEKLLTKCLTNWEKEMPLTEQDIVIHLLIHMIPQMKNYGPCRGYWMFPYERFFKFACDNIHATTRIEANLFENWLTKLSFNFIDLTDEILAENRFIDAIRWPLRETALKLKNSKWDYFIIDEEELRFALACSTNDYNSWEENMEEKYANYAEQTKTQKKKTEDRTTWMLNQKNDGQFTDEEELYVELPTQARKQQAATPSHVLVQLFAHSLFCFFFLLYVQFNLRLL